MERSVAQRYKVTVERSTETPLELLVPADGWVEAWQEGLRAMGIEAFPSDAVCNVQGDIVRIRAPSLAASFLIETSTTSAEESPPSAPLPAARGQSAHRSARRTTPLSRMKPVLGPPDGEKPPRRLSPGPAPSLRLDPELNTTAPARPAVMPGQPGQNDAARDPLDALLDLLARQRQQSNPVQISEKTGLPTPVTRPITRLTRPATPQGPLTTVEADRPNSDELALPQQFHPVLTSEPLAETNVSDPLEWAVNTAWQHIPCDAAIAVSLEDGLLEILAVCCEEPSKWLEATVRLPQNWFGLVARAPGRTRYPNPVELELELPDRIEPFSVSSVIGAPVVHSRPLALLLLNSPRVSGFTDAEVRALAYLGRTLEGHLVP